jgi:hypothetical protein
MQFYSFDMNDPLIRFDGWSLSFQIITFENIYGLAADHLTLTQLGNGLHISADALSWAGQQQRTEGSFDATLTRETDGRLRLRMTATCAHPIRAVKLLVRDLPAFTLFDMLGESRDVPDAGLLDRYPNSLRMPLEVLRLSSGKQLGVRVEDAQTRAKRFAAFQERMGELRGTYTLECIHEEDARHFGNRISVPDWILERDVDFDAFTSEHLAYNEAVLGLQPWEIRPDLPEWGRDIQLCLTLHGMHWSGYVFNTYAQMLDIIRYATDRVPGQRILAYLPGWDGRYYWKAGDFSPDPALGGEAGFAELCREARALGVHVMPMIAGTCANAWAPEFQRFGPQSLMKSPSRNVFVGNQPDWDLSRSRDTGWQAWLNVAAPGWQDELVRQLTTLTDTYGFDALFLDCSEVWINDPDYNLLEGYKQLIARLRDGRPNLLVSGEDWWDGLLGIFPVFQRSAYGRQIPPWVKRYARLIGHIQEPEPSRGSTGVFESGYEDYKPLPTVAPYMTTLAFTDGTFTQARAQVDAVLETVRHRLSEERE